MRSHLKLKTALLFVMTVFLLSGIHVEARESCHLKAVFWRYNMPRQEQFYRGLADAFSRTHSDCPVDISLQDWSSAHVKLSHWAAGKPGPDITVCPDTWLAEFQPAFWPYPADLRSAFLERFNSKILERSRIANELTGLPWACSTKALFVRSDLLHSLGLSAPKTWRQLLSTARAIKNKFGIPGIAIPGAPQPDCADNFYFFLWTNGAELRPGRRGGLLSERAQEALRFYGNLALKYNVVQPGFLEDDRSAIERLFADGKVGMVETGPWLIQLIAERKVKVPYEVVALPKRLTPGTQLVTDDLVIMSASRHRDAALQFVRFAYQSYWRRQWTKLGMVPELLGILSDPDIANNPVWKPFVAELPFAHWIPMVPWAEADRLISQDLHEFLAGQRTDQSVLYDMNVILSRLEKKRNQRYARSHVIPRGVR